MGGRAERATLAVAAACDRQDLDGREAKRFRLDRAHYDIPREDG